MVTHNAYMKQL